MASLDARRATRFPVRLACHVAPPSPTFDELPGVHAVSAGTRRECPGDRGTAREHQPSAPLPGVHGPRGPGGARTGHAQDRLRTRAAGIPGFRLAPPRRRLWTGEHPVDPLRSSGRAFSATRQSWYTRTVLKSPAVRRMFFDNDHQRARNEREDGRSRHCPATVSDRLSSRAATVSNGKATHPALG
jgi:hypothetical protein